MRKNATLGGAISDQVRKARRAAREAVANARRSGEEHHISVTGRTNVVAKVNSGEDGAVSIASARQESPIIQGPDEETSSDTPRSGT